MDRPTSPEAQAGATRAESAARAAGWQQTVERVVVGLGYELVDCDKGSQGLLRVFIDRVPGHSYPTGDSEFVTVDDCEKVTRQLQYALEVEDCNYSRLEVSSPGLDRPLKKPADFARFVGCEVDVTLRQVFQGRKKWRGVLEAVVEPQTDSATEPPAGLPAAPVTPVEATKWRVVFTSDSGQPKALGFSLDEVREARLVPVVNFKGRAKRMGAPAAEQGQQSGGTEE